MVLFGSTLLGWISVDLWLDRSVALRLAGASDGIGTELGVTETFD